jgi:hypothetical protein
MKVIMSWIKVCVTNFLIMFALIGVLLLSPPLVYSIYVGVTSFFSPSSTPVSQDRVYKEFEWRADHFRELNELTTSYSDFLVWRHDNYIGKTININRGNRQTYANGRTASSKQKFWFFGGSTTWGLGVPDDLTFPSFFAKHTGLGVKNFGETGYIARQSLSYLQNIIIVDGDQMINEDLHIVFYDGVNEIITGCRSDVSGLSTSQQNWIRELLKFSSEDEKKYSFVRTFGQLLDLFKAILKRAKIDDGKSNTLFEAYSCKSDPDIAMNVASNLVRTWKSVSEIAESRGAKFTAVLQPVAFIGSPKIGYLNINSPSDNQIAAQYQSVYPLIRDLANSFDFDFIDLSKAYDDCDNCYIDFCHVGPQAHDRLTKSLIEKLAFEAQ